MDAKGWIALWGAVLSTALAILQFVNWRRDRPKVSVTAAITLSPISDIEDPDTRGTPVTVQHGSDALPEEMLITFTIVNGGGKALQISAVVIESIAGDHVNIKEITPHPLPVVLEPLTSIITTVQKETIDMEKSITFIGVVDALGRRYGVEEQACKALVLRSWEAPTRVAWFRRRDDPTAPMVQAFRMLDRSVLSTRPLRKGRWKTDHIIVDRAAPTPPDSNSTDPA
jgi:hypothetical protein